MLENADKQSCGEGADGSDVDYLLRAKDACAQGDAVLGMHLYLDRLRKRQRELPAIRAPRLLMR